MGGFLGETYLWVKALHILSVITWMAAFLYLPRLYVYHCQAEPGSKQSETFKVMESKLSRLIMRPAMLVSLALGLVMISIPGTPGYLGHASGWVWLKLVLVVGLVAVHLAMMRWRDDFALDRNERPQRFFRFANEIPTLLMIGIVICVVVKPF